MGKNQILGAIILVAGIIILGFAFNASDATLEQMSETLTGRFSDQTMMYFLIGGVAAVGGGLLFAFGQRR